MMWMNILCSIHSAIDIMMNEAFRSFYALPGHGDPRIRILNVRPRYGGKRTLFSVGGWEGLLGNNQ